MTTRTICAMVTGLALSCASAARAQAPASSTTPGSTMPLGDKVFVSLNLGAQTSSATLTKDWSFPIYRESATSTTSASVRSSFFEKSWTQPPVPQASRCNFRACSRCSTIGVSFFWTARTSSSFARKKGIPSTPKDSSSSVRPMLDI